MTFDLTRILHSKREFRRRLAARPIEEKLAMLDALRERALTLRESRLATETNSLPEQTPPYQAQRERPEKT